jgi:hypothetical protein
MPTLIDAELFLQKEVAKGDWMLQFGEGRIGTTCGVAYVYVRTRATSVSTCLGTPGRQSSSNSASVR